MPYIEPSGKAHNPSEYFKKLLVVLCRLAEGSGVNHAAKVLVQMFPENVHIHLLEFPMEFAYEFDLRGA